MLLQSNTKIFFFLSNLKEKKQKWFFLRSFFKYKKIKRKPVSSLKFVYFTFFIKITIFFLKKFFKTGNSSAIFKNFFNSMLYFKKENKIDFLFLFMLFIDQLRLPFLLRSKKIAGRLYQIPMVTSIDSQFNLVLRNLLKLTRLQHYRSFFSYTLFHLKLSYLNQSYLYNNLSQVATTATDNLRFVRFRWT